MKITDSPIAGRLWALAATVLLSYAGYDQYEKATTATETTVNVNVEGVDAAPVHAHGEVLSREQVQALIAAAITAHDKELGITYKKLESWEKN